LFIRDPSLEKVPKGLKKKGEKKNKSHGKPKEKNKQTEKRKMAATIPPRVGRSQTILRWNRREKRGGF